jgi:hypothetical protein
MGITHTYLVHVPLSSCFHVHVLDRASICCLQLLLRRFQLLVQLLQLLLLPLRNQCTPAQLSVDDLTSTTIVIISCT